MLVTMLVLMRRSFIVVMMFMPVLVSMFMFVMFGFIVVMIFLEVDIELGTRDMCALLFRNVQVITVQAKFLQLVFEAVKVHAQVQQRAEKHVAADAAENVEVKRLHALAGWKLISAASIRFCRAGALLDAVTSASRHPPPAR